MGTERLGKAERTEGEEVQSLGLRTFQGPQVKEAGKADSHNILS